MATDLEEKQIDLRTVVGIGVFQLTLFVIIGLAFAWAGMRPGDFRLAVLLIVPATVALLVPVYAAMQYRPYDILHPLNFVALSIFFGVFGRSLYLLTSQSEVAKDLLEGYTLAAIVPGAILSAIGAAVLCLGFAAVGERRLRLAWLSEVLRKMDTQRLCLLLPIFFLLSAAATYFFIQATGFDFTGIASLSTKRRVMINGVESSMGYHRLIAQDLSRVMLLILTAWFLRAKDRSLWFPVGLGLFGLLAIALPFLASSRSNVLLTVIAVCVVVSRIRGISLKSLAVCGLVCVVTLTSMLALRRENNQGASASETILNLGMEPFFGNKSFACLVKLGHIYNGVPDLIPYHYGSSYLSVLYAPVPRAIWTNKPPVLLGRMVSEKLYNRGLDLKEKGGGTPPGLFSEAIINFGIVGFPLVVFAFGFLLGLLHNSLARLSDNSIAGAALYAAVVPVFTLQLLGGEFSAAAIKLGTGVVLVVAIALSTRVKLLF